MLPLTCKDLLRFEQRIDRSSHPKGCWVWAGYVLLNAYGSFWLHGKGVGAHRVAYAVANNRSCLRRRVMSQNLLAKNFNVSHFAIHAIKTGKTHAAQTL